MRTGAIVMSLALLGTGTGQALAENVRHKVEGYEITLSRDGRSHEFQGWIRLYDATRTIGYVYIQDAPQMRPRLGSDGYVVIDIPVRMLDATLRMLDSGKPVFISYGDDGDPDRAFAFLDVGGEAPPSPDEAEFLRREFSLPGTALRAAE